ncbi:ATP-binding protein [Pseudomonas sp. MH10]|uniref:ATP-binding protein n=1 Tax=Pseudomonas sp. MH10 TaxID=3048627 RepID=UPI002AC8BF6D|nr:ATP-binding protein [Pseudomonas sp. MH10]MEB0039123.1 ATP-binding protein [Pseudomonas sp. MH10]WPX62580.1 ATP-binding protein [Pseudomonas sp. MH10]
MMTWGVDQLYQELLELDEHSRIEAKKAEEIGSSIMQTVCAFANEPGLGGGWLLLGVSEPDEFHASYWVNGIQNVDKLLGDLQTNCRNQFEQSVQIQSKHALIDGKLVVAVHVPELELAAKPCRFSGKLDKKNKKKTGVWRRGANGDYECTEAELEPILLAKSGIGFEQTLPLDAEWTDLDPSAIQLYRDLRSKVRSHAPELQEGDEEMLRALNLVNKSNGIYRPNLAGLLLLGKAIALRRLLPAMRVDYVRVQGNEWVADAEQRFSTTLDLRESLLRLIPRLEATILDDMPSHFRLSESQTQRADQPLLPHNVVREAVVNAVMHRDYQINQPVLVVRYSNRLEIRNPGYSLKPDVELGEMGSRQRNPVIAAVLYELNFAETKGSGIRTMKKLLDAAGLTAPVFSSNRESNQFGATYLLHQLLGEDQLQWLKHFQHYGLTDNEAKALILVKEIGAIDNSALRAITGLDTLQASHLLRKLWQHLGLIEKGGSGRSSYYVPSLILLLGNEPALQSFQMELAVGQEAVDDEDVCSFTQVFADFAVNASDLQANASDLQANASDLQSNASDLGSSGDQTVGGCVVSEAIKVKILGLTAKARKDKLWPIILELCSGAICTAEQLAGYLSRNEDTLKTNHLRVMRELGLLTYLHPEVINHPNQAYKTTPAGLEWIASSAACQRTI